MSRQLINEYRAELDRLRAVSGRRRESVLREAFKDLLKRWGRAHDLQFVAEQDIVTRQMNRIYVDGALLHGLRVPFGYWEAKDESDDLAAEIKSKFRKGYPRDNIVFTDDITAVLYQDGTEVMRAVMQGDDDSLLNLLTRFFAHERQEIAVFNKAVKQFAHDLPDILKALRDRIAEKRAKSPDFSNAVAAFLQHARNAINPAVGEDDVREMLIQHILTEDIFAKVFNDPDFHRKNNVAAELYKLEDKLFGRGDKATLLRALDPYYAGITSTAALIQSHSEKQGFLKALYEDFYRAYNRKAADRLGVVYTPGEIVRFMIRSADWLCEKHFGKNLIDRGVEILDPAAGTGTFIVELLEHFRGNKDKLRDKYKEELHANEVAILPYYVANLNIEATYQAITGQFAEYENLCLVDTLDNVAALHAMKGEHFGDLLGGISDENIERIKRQNRRDISVIIGNPPYNASQKSENENNKNRDYPNIDRKISQSYVRLSSAQRTGSYDMFTRFFRWSSDRINQSEGIIAFITNRIYIDGQNADGIRKSFQNEFCEAWVIDLGGDVRRHPQLSGTTHNVFGIQTGVAICFLVKNKARKGFTLHFADRNFLEKAEDKLSFLSSGQIGDMAFREIRPRSHGRWLDARETDFESFAPISEMTGGRNPFPGYIFHLGAPGVMSGRDEWVYSRRQDSLRPKIEFLHDALEGAQLDGSIDLTKVIKTSSTLSSRRSSSQRSPSSVVESAWRPFQDRWFYFNLDMVDRLTENHVGMFGEGGTERNTVIAFLGVASSHPLAAFATRHVYDYGLLKTGNGGTQGVSRYRYTKSGERVDNITDWALKSFVAHFGKRADITKDAIFHYVYAVLHDPIYRETYAPNLKREFPRIPFYLDFASWAAWGEALMTMHIGYEDVEPWVVERIDAPKKRAKGTHPRPILQSVPEQRLVRVDDETQIAGIPREAWDYRLGNRSAIDWVLDQHKEKILRYPTIREQFNTYRFADYKEGMLTLLARVVRVSVNTVAITQAMKASNRPSAAVH